MKDTNIPVHLTRGKKQTFSELGYHLSMHKACPSLCPIFKLWNIKQGEAGGNPRPLPSTKNRHLQLYWIVTVFESLTVSIEMKKVFSSCQITMFSLKQKTCMLNASVKDSERCTLTLNQWSSCLSSGQSLIHGGGSRWWPVLKKFVVVLLDSVSWTYSLLHLLDLSSFKNPLFFFFKPKYTRSYLSV